MREECGICGAHVFGTASCLVCGSRDVRALGGALGEQPSVVPLTPAERVVPLAGFSDTGFARRRRFVRRGP